MASNNGPELLTAIEWIVTLITGPFATAIGVVVVAIVGLGFLTGNLNARRVGQATIGLFVLFGAPNIAAGIMAAVLGAASPPQTMVAAPSPNFTRTAESIPQTICWACPVPASASDQGIQ